LLHSAHKFAAMEFNIKENLLITKSYNFDIITIYTGGAGDDNIKLHALCTLLYSISNCFLDDLSGSPEKLKISNLDYKNYPLYLLIAFFNWIFYREFYPGKRYIYNNYAGYIIHIYKFAVEDITCLGLQDCALRTLIGLGEYIKNVKSLLVTAFYTFFPLDSGDAVLDFLDEFLLFGIIAMITAYCFLELNPDAIKANMSELNIEFAALEGKYIGDFLFINSSIKIWSSFYKAVAKEISEIGVPPKYSGFKGNWKYLEYKT